MNRLARIAEAANLAALAAWLGCLLGAGAAAAVIFPTMRGLDPSLPAFAGYAGEHWRIAGGAVANRLFVLCDAVQLAAATVCVLALIVARIAGAPPASRAAFGARLAFLAAAWLLASYEIFVLAPRMQESLALFWTSAKAGDTPAADAARAVFEADHPTASRVLGATAGAVLGALLASAWGLTARPRETGP